MTWHLKIIPMIGPLIRAIQAKNWLLVAKYLATIATIIFLGTGLVVLSGCGSLDYSSTGKLISQPTPQANQQVIERIQTPAQTTQSEILAPK